MLSRLRWLRDEYHNSDLIYESGYRDGITRAIRLIEDYNAGRTHLLPQEPPLWEQFDGET